VDKIDKQLLDIIQNDFPITPEPYKQLALSLQISPKEVMDRIRALYDEGIIRRLGGVFDSRKVGYTSTLCAIKVPESRISDVARIINVFPGVTHNYLREDDYNMWFTLIAPSRDEIKNICEKIKEQSGINDLIELPAERIFKIKVKFSVKGDE